MKAGAEAHFLAGQLFTLGIAAAAILPRMPTDSDIFPSFSVGGTVSFPFRRMLLVLILVGVIRVTACHLHHFDSRMLATVDGVLGTIHVMGQTFLCLATAYILQCQLQNYVNIRRYMLLPMLALILLLTVTGAVLSSTVHPNWWCLVNLAEAASCFPVLQTLKTYASVTTIGGRHGNRGSFLVQLLKTVEYWYMATALLSFFSEALDDYHGNLDGLEGRPEQIILEAFRHNQDNGIDDWTRLLVHSIFLNSLDEMQHFSSSPGTRDFSQEEVQANVEKSDLSSMVVLKDARV